MIKKRLCCSFTAILLLLLSIFCPMAKQAWASGGYYIAQGGENLASLGEELALDAQTLALINDRSVTEPLEMGTLIRLPEVPCMKVQVQAGDTLMAFARTYQVSVQELAMQNGLRDSDRIYAGQELLIPLHEEQAVCTDSASEEAEKTVYASRTGIAYQWPLRGTITSPYGKRWGSFHWGLDIADDEGRPIAAAAGGWVKEAGWKNDAYGYTVMLDHGNGIETLYAHASALAVQEGQKIEAGQTIAYVGSTGNSTGPHVHFEIRLDGVCVDPLQYLQK